uniref:NADH-ubiquinone oxidoreductase chain 4 n=2 Tax=Diplometopon zarudnyi TaxID=94420 RepID=Q66SW7_DIPZA|nr:NADH dehydrogenase subunit 4 [Diplometopon zarudnyi]AAT08512.1 NADH dehydrogenase subunit 4 [Diplometopon zarudnyi]
MLKILLPTIMLIPSTALIPQKLIFMHFTMQAMLIATLSLLWLHHPLSLHMTCLTPITYLDTISTPLLVLSCWLLPLMALASQQHMHQEPKINQRMFLITITILQCSLLLTFSASEFIMFYIMFETTIIPTLMLITRWGSQQERLAAGTYFLFYTLISSLPLLMALVFFYTEYSHMSLIIMKILPQTTFTWGTSELLWSAGMLAFLVKLPLYGVHLWLPKAHVEAPIAGSMVLAAILLKLGGYGMIRIMPIIPEHSTLSLPLLALALWGSIMANIICLRQTDLKSLIAYSSVGHMALVILALMTKTAWGLTGALTLMIAHGLTSSMTFCLANTTYERTNTRTLLLATGLQLILPLMTTWWLLASLTNMAMPPSINLIGELSIITTLYHWSPMTVLPLTINTLLTATYTLYMFITTQRGKPMKMKTLHPAHTREHLLLLLHLVPLLLLILKPTLIMTM